MTKTKITKDLEFYVEELGFNPNTPKKEMVKYWAKVIADKKLSEIYVNDPYVIGIKIPVWPAIRNGKELKYYKKGKKWCVSYLNGILLTHHDEMLFNNIPDFKDYSYEDYNDHPFQFLIVASSNPELKAGTIAHTRPEAKAINFFKFNGEELVMLTSMSIMFTEEV